MDATIKSSNKDRSQEKLNPTNTQLERSSYRKDAVMLRRVPPVDLMTFATVRDLETKLQSYGRDRREDVIAARFVFFQTLQLSVFPVFPPTSVARREIMVPEA